MLIPKFGKYPKTDSERSQRSALPGLSMLLTLSKLFVFEIIAILRANFPVAIQKVKKYRSANTWGIKFNKADSIRILKDTAFALLPFLIVSFVLSSILINRLPGIIREFFNGESSSLAVALWLLSFALGIGLVVSANGSVDLGIASIGGETSNTIRVIASGLTIYVIYVLAKRAMKRHEDEKFVMNFQSEVVASGFALSGITLISTLLGSTSFSGSEKFSDYGASGNISIRPELFTLVLSPLVVTAAANFLSLLLAKKKKITGIHFVQMLNFYKSISAVGLLILLIGVVVTRNISNLVLGLIFFPSFSLVTLAFCSGVPFSGIESSSSSGNGFIDFSITSVFHPSLGLVFWLLLTFFFIVTLGALNGFAFNPEDYSIRRAARVSLLISASSVVLGIYLSLYFHGESSAVFDLVSESNKAFIAPNFLILPFIAIFWGAAFEFGGKYVATLLGRAMPKFLVKYLPKIRITPSAYYELLFSDPQNRVLTPSEIESRREKKAKAISLLRKLLPAAFIIFLIFGPLNSLISTRISSPTATIEDFFASLNSGKGDKAAASLYLGDNFSDGTINAGVVSSYLAKPILKNFEITYDENSADLASAYVEYDIDGELSSTTMTLVRDRDQKRYGIFPTWKINSLPLYALDIAPVTGVNYKIGNADLLSKTEKVYLLPGKFEFKIENAIGYTSTTIKANLDGGNSIVEQNSDLKPESRSRIIELVRNSLDTCNSQNFAPGAPDCPYVDTYRYGNLTFDSFNNLNVSNFRIQPDGVLFNVDFTGRVQFRDLIFRVNYQGDYSTVGRNLEVFLRASDNFETITWSENYSLYR